MKIVTVVGARPQFVKAAAVSRILRKSFTEILVHTGQHYDDNMSKIFFDELSIPQPDYNLGVGSGSHAKQTADMLIKIEEVLLKEKPDYMLTYGDTNSTLAGALAAGKINIPIIHIEAGLRSFNMLMPEEQNRILTDRLSKYKFCPTDTAVRNLKNEGMTDFVYNVGDVMCDAVKYYEKEICKKDRGYYFDRMEFHYNKCIPKQWYLATIHRAETTDSIDKIENILNAFEEFDEKVIFPVHPRTIQMVKSLQSKNNYKNIIFIKPVGYIDMLFLIKNAKKVVTDSGGLQKEAYILGVDCITVRDQTEWVETLIGNYNVLCEPEKNCIIQKVYNTEVCKDARKDYYGDGNAAKKIVNILRG